MFCVFNYKYFPIFVNLFFRIDGHRLDVTAYTGTMPQVNVRRQQKSGLLFKPDQVCSLLPVTERRHNPRLFP